MLGYSYCGVALISNIVIPELPQSHCDQGGLLFTLEPARTQSRDFLDLYTWRDNSGEILLSYGEQNSYSWLRFPNLADFRISANAREIACYPLPEVPLETVRHLLLDQVLPRSLAHQGRVMVHASAVQLEQGVIFFIGDSGVGKSTLAGNFHQAGHPAISDDCLWIRESKDQIKAVPSYGGLRLWEDSLKTLFSPGENVRAMAHYSAKKRVALDNNLLKFRGGIPILALILLSPTGATLSSEVSLERLSRREAFIGLMKQSFHLNVMDLKRMKRHIQALGCIVPKVPAFRLSMPRDYDLLSIVLRRILEVVF